MAAVSAVKAPERAGAPEIFDFAAGAPDAGAILAQLDALGYAVLRNLFAADDLAAFLAARERWFARPAAGGAPGYSKYDYPKKVVQTSLLGPAALRMILEPRLIGLIERYCGASVVVSESFTKLDRAVDYVYFPAHSDYFEGYLSSESSSRAPLTAEDMAGPLGLSYVMYHHDTASGAFCFAAGSHKQGARLGGMLDAYPEDERDAVLRGWTRIDGRAGDIVLFDPRGFHGQDQPSRADRHCTITRYWRIDVFGRVQHRPMPVYVNDLAGLTPGQLETLGLGAASLTPLEADHHGRFKLRRLSYRLATLAIEHAYDLDHLKRRLRPAYVKARALLGGKREA